jgi:hypothetical protein
MIQIKPINKESFDLLSRISLLLFIVLISTNSFSQNRTPRDIRRVTVTNRYTFTDEKSVGQAWPIYQEIFDSLGRRHTEIEFKFLSTYPYIYRWHTFNGRLIVKSEFFENEKLQMIKEFKYNSDSLIFEETIKRVKPGDTSVYLILNYKYNKQKKPILIEAKTSLGKKAYKSKATFDAKGTEISRVVDCKHGFFPLDSIIKLTSIPVYDSLGRLTSNLVSTLKIGNQTTIKNYKYVYDKKNNIVDITILDNKGARISREQRIYQENKNRIIQIKKFDSKNNLLIWLGLRYEIYRTKEHKTREIDY